MLLRNVIQNALQHTTGAIQIHLDTEKITIQDQGSSTKNNIDWTSPSNQIPTQGGLGLYLVTLMCEQLNWTLHIESLEHAGTLITLTYNSTKSL